MPTENINPILYITHPLNGILMIIVPIILGVYLVKRFKLSWGLFFIGGFTFILSQVFRFPFLWGVSAAFDRGIFPHIPPAWHFTFNLLFLSISAGIFEECARYFMYRSWVKKARSWGQGILLGAGHGGMEAIILGALVLYGFFQMMAILGQDLTTFVPSDQLEMAEQQVREFWSLKWYLSLFGAVERILTLPLHICLSVMVLQVFVRRQMRWLGLAIGWHALINAAGVYMFNTSGMIAAEVVIGLGAAISIANIFYLRDHDIQPDMDQEYFSSPREYQLKKIDKIEETEDIINKTR